MFPSGQPRGTTPSPELTGGGLIRSAGGWPTVKEAHGDEIDEKELASSTKRPGIARARTLIGHIANWDLSISV